MLQRRSGGFIIGTVINAIAILIGGSLGLLLGRRLPERTQETVMHGLGIVTLLIGVQMSLRTRNVLIVLFSILLGGVLGEACGLDERLNALGRRVESGLDPASSSQRSISRAFVAAALLFCVGPIAILGAMQDGLLGDRSLLMVKSTLDLFASLALSASLGPGVLIAVVPVLLYQGGLSLAAHFLGGWLGAPPSADTAAIVELTATGGVVIVALGLNLLEVKKIRVANLLPAVALAPLFVSLLTALSVKW